MPSGPLGVTIVDNEAGVYVQNKSSDRTELLGRDTIRCVGFVPVKTITECTKAIQNEFHSKRTLTIERNVSKSVGESNMEQDRLPEQINAHPALSGQKRSYQEAINLIKTKLENLAFSKKEKKAPPMKVLSYSMNSKCNGLNPAPRRSITVCVLLDYQITVSNCEQA